MADHSGPRRVGTEAGWLDAAAGLAGALGRLGYRLISLPAELLPGQSRRHIHNALRELSYGFVSLPRDFAEIAGAEVERWAAGWSEPQVAPLGAAPAGPTLAPAGLGAAPAAATLTISHIEYDPPGRDVDGEYVLISNPGPEAVDLSGWTLSDGGARHVYVFPAVSLAAGAELRLWTKRGADDGANRYWNSRTAIWNNDGDTGTLRDASGAVVSVYSYKG